MLLLPGPVDVPEVVLNASSYVQNHRSQEFREIVARSQELLNTLTDARYSLMTTGSGTSAVESIIYSMIGPGEKVMAVSFGEFGNRIIESLQRRGADPVPLKKSIDSTLEKGEITDFFGKNPGIKTIFLVQNETGNGTAVRNLRDIADEANGLGLKVFVDSVSSIGGMEVKASKWGIHAIAGCSQKGLASVPGIGTVSISEDGARYVREDRDMPSYLDLSNSIRFMGKQETPYTPSTGSFRALLTALRILQREGIQRRWDRHHASALFTRKKLKEAGFELYGNDGNYSDTVVAFRPETPAPELVGKLRERGISVSKGMKDLADIMIRAGLLGVVDGDKISTFLNTLFEITGKEIRVNPEDLPPETSIDREIFNVEIP